MDDKIFKPYIAPDRHVREFTVKSVVFGALFGILFGCSTVYLALKAGLTVSASIPIAVIAITLGRKYLKTTILENNIIQTAGSAGESIAAGVVFTLPGFLFLSPGADGKSVGESYFTYLTILILAALGGMLGTLMMIPLRRSLIVKEHGVLPYPEGTACAAVLQAGEKGGVFAQTAFIGMGIALGYAILQKVVHVIAETPAFITAQANRFWPSAATRADITPEYLGVGYIIGPRIGGVLVARVGAGLVGDDPVDGNAGSPRYDRYAISQARVHRQHAFARRNGHREVWTLKPTRLRAMPMPSTGPTYARLAPAPWPPVDRSR